MAVKTTIAVAVLVVAVLLVGLAIALWRVYGPYFMQGFYESYNRGQAH